MSRMAKQKTTERTAVAGLRAELSRQDVSGRELARRINVTPVYVSRRISGAVDPSSTDLERFAEALGVTVGRLFGEVSQ